MPAKFVPLKTRFDQKWRLDAESGCWIWEGAAQTCGYGLISVNAKFQKAHRIAWELYRGAIPEGMVIDHKCRRRNCVNPDHLEPVTDEENIRRGWRTRHLPKMPSLRIEKKRSTERERFDAKWKLNLENGCWEWLASTWHGYGIFYCSEERCGTNAHRVAWRLYKGPIPDGLHIDHLCRNRRCVNPDHLEPVTQAINNLRVPNNIADRARARTHCPQGHLYDEANTYLLKDGRRDCRECRNQAQRNRRSAKSTATGFVAYSERTHCPYGHEYNEMNTMRAADGHRGCRVCNRERARAKFNYKSRHRSKYQEVL